MTFCFEDKSSISVEVLEKHRKSSLSSYLVSRIIEETIRLQHSPIWDCSDDNITFFGEV